MTEQNNDATPDGVPPHKRDEEKNDAEFLTDFAELVAVAPNLGDATGIVLCHGWADRLRAIAAGLARMYERDKESDADPRRPKWEHQNMLIDPTNMLADLNKLGKQGWEIAMLLQTDVATPQGVRWGCLFKRRVVAIELVSSLGPEAQRALRDGIVARR